LAVVLTLADKSVVEAVKLVDPVVAALVVAAAVVVAVLGFDAAM
jgi:hypothetical protein